jgi:hypothetical protein
MGKDFFLEKEESVAFDGWDRTVASGVAVAGWQWCHSTEEIKAVRMVPVAIW